MLRLRPLRPDDETAFRRGHQELAAEGFIFGLGLEPGLAWDEYLRQRWDHRAGANLPDGFVPNTFLVADMQGQLVGRVSIRHQLNDILLREGGHIGYSVLPAHRRRGYATEILRQSLIIAWSLGIDRALVICNDDNIGSARVIESCGGVLDSVLPATADHAAVRRYWIS